MEPTDDSASASRPADSSSTSIPNTASASGSNVPPPVDSTGKEIEDPIKIMFHPSSGRKEEVVSHHEYRNKTTHMQAPTDKVPWAPFRTRADYEFAKIALAASLTAQQNNALISLIKRISSGETEFTLVNNTDLRKTWDRASSKLTPVSTIFSILLYVLKANSLLQFETKTIEVPYKKEMRSYLLHFWPIWNWVEDILRNPNIVSRFTWDSCQLYKYNKISKCYTQFINEPWTADRFWELQVCIKRNSFLFKVT